MSDPTDFLHQLRTAVDAVATAAEKVSPEAPGQEQTWSFFADVLRAISEGREPVTTTIRPPTLEKIRADAESDFAGWPPSARLPVHIDAEALDLPIGNGQRYVIIQGDTFHGDNAHLVACMRALVDLDVAGALVPHGIGSHARDLLTTAAYRLEYAESVRRLSIFAMEELREKATYGWPAGQTTVRVSLNALKEWHRVLDKGGEIAQPDDVLRRARELVVESFVDLPAEDIRAGGYDSHPAVELALAALKDGRA